MILKIVLCLACVQAVAVGVVSGKSLLAQPYHPGSSSADRALLTAQDKQHNARHLVPHHPSGRRPSISSVRHGSEGGGKASVHVCGLCPNTYETDPCTCQCLNQTAAAILCGPDLTTCEQLNEVMSLTTYPVNAYLRLEVADTNLGCVLGRELWGQVVFKEIVITYNRFQVLDNGAFRAFSETLTALNLEGNSLEYIYFATLSDTPLLKFVSLRNNAVDFLPGYSAMVLPVLETFDASYNKIDAIRAQTFAGMPKLRKLELSNNVITKVSSGAFTIPMHDSSDLYINLANNLITSIEPGVLEGVRVCTINLENNRLTALREKVFRPIIDFTKASSRFLTNDNPFDCDSGFCWIATNNTVSGTFNTVLCPNLNNDPVEVLVPMCSAMNTTMPAPHSRRRTKALPPSVAFRNIGAPAAVRNRRNPFLWQP